MSATITGRCTTVACAGWSRPGMPRCPAVTTARLSYSHLVLPNGGIVMSVTVAGTVSSNQQMSRSAEVELLLGVS